MADLVNDDVGYLACDEKRKREDEEEWLLMLLTTLNSVTTYIRHEGFIRLHPDAISASGYLTQPYSGGPALWSRRSEATLPGDIQVGRPILSASYGRYIVSDVVGGDEEKNN